MKPEPTITSSPRALESGHRSGVDTTGKRLFNSTLITSGQEQRFESAVERLGDLRLLPPNVALLCALPKYEVVLTQQGLRAAADRLGDVYQLGENLVLDWDLSRGWRDRRYLHGVTRGILLQCDKPPRISSRDWGTARKLLQAALDEADARQVWQTYCACASAWWSSRIPKLLWSHCTGQSPMQPLTRQTWVRHETKRPLVVETSRIDFQSPDRDAYFSAARQSAQESSIADAVLIVTENARAHGSRQAFVVSAVAELTDHLRVAAAHGRLQVLLVGFIIDLLCNGGELGALGIGSIVAYLTSTLILLFRALIKADLDELNGEGWWTLYTGLVTSASARKEHIQATLTAFHSYLEWLGVPSLPRHLGHGTKPLPPHAEVVWKHEVARAVKRLEPLALNGDRIAEQAIVALLMLSDFMVRVEEVLGLRVGDFHPPLEARICFVYPRTRDGKIKSDAVRRPVDLSDPTLLLWLRRWLAKRNQERAQDEDFLFGEPRKSRMKFEHGKTYRLMSWALKVSSGEASVGTHGCRHRLGSEQGEAVLVPHTPTTDVNMIDQISAGAGQSVTESTRETYLNIWEGALAAHCRDAWAKERQETTTDVPAWCEPIEAGFAIDLNDDLASTVPIFDQAPKRDLTKVMEVVEDLMSDMNPTSIAARNRVSEADVESIARTCFTTLRKVLGDKQRQVGGSPDMHAVRLELIRRKPVLRAARQPKYSPIVRWMNSELESAPGRALLDGSIEECKSIVKNGYVALMDPSACGATVAIVQAAKVPKKRLLITHTTPRNDLSPEVIALAWPLRPERQVRRGQWPVRMHITSIDSSSRRAIDGVISMKGFLGLLAIAKAWVDLAKMKECNQ